MKSSLSRDSLYLRFFASLLLSALAPLAALADDFDGLSTPSFWLDGQNSCSGRPASGQSRGNDQGRAEDQGFFPWAPSGLGPRAPYRGCEPWAIRETLLRSSSPAQQTADLRRLVATCDPSWKRNDERLIASLFAIAQVRYDFCGNSRIRRAYLRLDDGSLLRGYLALKPGHAQRPLVILRCGLLCNAGDVSHRFMMMHLFDESPFNVLAVANVTGSDFVHDNQRVSIGGLEEGAQFQQIARIVSRSGLRRLTSSYHLASVSLGGQGVLYAAVMNPHARARGVPTFASAMALCPVVDLRPSARHLFTNDWRGQVAKRVFFDDVYEAISSFPALRAFFPRNQADQIPDEVADAAVARLSMMGVGWAPPPFQTTQIRTRDEFWRAHRFMDVPIPPNATPTLAFAAEDDWIVEPEANARSLAATLRPDGPINVAIAPRGNHCAFSAVYGWETASEIYRSWILSRSPEFYARRRIRSANVDPAWFARELAIGPNQAFARFEFSAAAGSPDLEFAAWIWDPFLPAPCASPFDAQRSCVYSRRFRIPLSSFAGAPWARTPSTETEAEALVRSANASLRFVDADGRIAMGRNRAPTRIVWESFED